MEMRKNGLEELVDCFDDWVCPELVHDEDRSRRVRVWAMVSTELGARGQETRRTPELWAWGLMPKTHLSSMSSRLG